MKRRLLSLLLAAVLVLSLVPVLSQAAVTDYPLLGSNFNDGPYKNGPEYYNTLSFKVPYRIDAISLFHWNGGKGAAPGTVSLYEDDVKVGTWTATGRAHNGVANAWWDVYPGCIVKAGHEYDVRCSSNSTWSWNDQSGAGMLMVRGTKASDLPAAGYTCSGWAKAEIQKAEAYGLLPSSLAKADLTKPISRRDFASISLRAYEKMANVTVVQGQDRPFTDTTDPDVLKAYGMGIVLGTSATTFGPTSNLTREQASTMLTRAYKRVVLPGWSLAEDSSFHLKYTKPAAFADQSKISSYALDSVAFMASQGILMGVGGNKFAPRSNVTREQALAIAVRMVDGLDTTPQPVEPVVVGGASEGPASGTLTNGDAAVTFTTKQPGQAVLTKDGAGYDLLLTDEMTGTVSVTFPALAPTDGTENVVFLGVPCLDEKGNQDFEKFPLDTTYSNGKVTATADLSEYANAVEDAAYQDATPTGKKNCQAEFAKKQAAAAGSKINVRTAVHFFCETEYLITSNSGHFRIYIPKSRYSTQEAAVMGKLNKADGKRIVEEMEGILSYYQGKYTIKRTSWPMKVLVEGGEGGEYSCGRMLLKIGSEDGYGRDLKASQKVYQTMCHELFHFVQREYAPVALSQSWFDEAAATYYGIQMGADRCGSVKDAMRCENYSADAEAQYQGIAPMDIATLGWFDFLHAGYGRASFIDYLMKTCGSDFLKRYYEAGITLAGLQTEGRLENLTGKSLGQLAEDFYTKLVLEKDTVNSVLSTPSNIFERNYIGDGSASEAGDAALDNVRTTWSLTGTGDTESTTIKVPRYGCCFTALDMSKINPGVRAFTLTVPTADCASRLVALNTNGESQYDTMKVYKPGADGKFQALPVDGTMYLLMMINTTGSWGWTVSETLNLRYDKLSASGAYPATIDQVPLNFEGSSGVWKGNQGASLIQNKSGASCRLSMEDGYLRFVIVPAYNSSDQISASEKGFFNGQGWVRAATSDGIALCAQLEAGKIVDRTKGPKPTAEQWKEYEESPSAFGMSIEGEKATNRIRILWVDKFGRLNYFEGTGVNDNSFYFDQAIKVD